MKIAIYKDTFANNRGADIAVRNLAAGLEERGHAVTLFDKMEFVVKVRGDYDVIISTGTNEILDLAKVEGLPPIVQQFHTDPRYPFRHWIKRWRRNCAIKAALEKVSAYQVLTPLHVGRLKKVLGCIPEGKIVAIGNWSGYERVGLPVCAAEKTIIFPGAINKDKNHALLVDAFAEIAAGFPDWQVHIYGKGKARDESALAKRIKSRKLGDRILLKGYADLTEAYSKCAFVAFPSKTEGFPLTIIDAAMFGKPSVTIEDWIGTCSAGGGISGGASVRSFAGALCRLMADVELRVGIGKAAQEFCRRKYSKNGIISSWERLLAEAAGVHA